MKLEKCPKTFTDEPDKVIERKIVWAHNAYDSSNYMEVLSQSNPFNKSDFHNNLTEEDITDEDYECHLSDWNHLKKLLGREPRRYELLKVYNENDTRIMVRPIDYCIQASFRKDKIDMLNKMTLAGCAQAARYRWLYEGFDIDGCYVEDNPGEANYVLYRNSFQCMCNSYKKQDKIKERDTSLNVSVKNYGDVKKLISKQNNRCKYYNRRFTFSCKPTLDRVDNDKAHTLDNVVAACLDCNRIKKRCTDAEIFRLKVQLNLYAYKYHLPRVVCNEHALKLLQASTLGGISNVMHRFNTANETFINHFRYDETTNSVISYDEPYVMTHYFAIDFNSMYPSVAANLERPFHNYTKGVMFMGSEFKKYTEDKTEMMQIITEKDHDKQIENGAFVVMVKGGFPKRLWNRYINCPPIIMKYNTFDIGTGEKNNTEKLTQTLTTMGKFTPFSWYYLWRLMDLGFIIEGVERMALFYPMTDISFQKFITSKANERIEAKTRGLSGAAETLKNTLNSSYGKDGQNTKKYSSISVLNESKAILKQCQPRFIDSCQLSKDCYVVQYGKDVYSIDTPLQTSVFTLDYAKYLLITFYYSFMVNAFDTQRFHFILCDTDSVYFAVAGDPNEGLLQGFKHIISDREFYENNYWKWLPREGGDKFDEKKLLGAHIESQGCEVIAIAPKCYNKNEMVKNEKENMWIEVEVNKMKGITAPEAKKLTRDDFMRVAKDGETIYALNRGLQFRKLEKRVRMVRLLFLSVMQ
jgi:hypothetical protein